MAVEACPHHVTRLTSAPKASLEAAGIEYVHLDGLGGFRKPRPDSPNPGWRKSAFRGFADYMQTSEFAAALDQLLKFAEGQIHA